MQFRGLALLMALGHAGAMRHPARVLPSDGNHSEVQQLNHSGANNSQTELFVANQSGNKSQDNHTLSAAEKAHAAQLRKKLQVVLNGLKGMVGGQNGSLSKAKVAPALQVFVNELDMVLSKEDTPLSKLTDAAAGLKTLMRELTARQESLMMEDENEHESLLLGVLMSKQHEPMEEQMEILDSPDFEKLPVAKALLANHSESVPLYMQVAEFLDKHKSREEAKALKGEAKERAAASAKLAESLQKRVESMEKELHMKEAAHKKRSELLAHAAKKSVSAKARHLAKAMQTKEARQFKKFAAVRIKDIASMKAAVDAVKRGDMKALEQARLALMASLKALKSQNGGFLVLLSLGHKTLGGDCPYCAAQCIDKCRKDGNSYAICLGNCADAGKGF